MLTEEIPFSPNNQFRDVNPIIASYLSSKEIQSWIGEYRSCRNGFTHSFIKKCNQTLLYKSAVHVLQFINKYEDKPPIKLSITNEVEYYEFCEKYYPIFYRIIDNFLNYQNDQEINDFIVECILHCCAIKHHDTWRLVQKSITYKQDEALAAIFKFYPDVSQLYKSAILEVNILKLLLSSPVDHQQLLTRSSLIQKLLRNLPENNEISEGLKKFQKSINTIYREFNNLIRKNDEVYYSQFAEEKNAKIYRCVNENFMYIFNYGNKNKTQHNIKFDKNILMCINAVLYQYIQKADLDNLFIIYDTHINATYFNQHRITAIFSKAYSANKINFIQNIQEKIIEKLSKNLSAKTLDELYLICKKIITHPVLSDVHLKHGVSYDSTEQFKEYFSSLRAICNSKLRGI